MSRAKALDAIFKDLRSLFTVARNYLRGRGVHKTAANFAAFGARGSFHSMSRSAAKKQLQNFFVNAELLGLDDFTEAVIEINIRALQQLYIAAETDNEDWVSNNLGAFAAAYAKAIAGHVRSSQYNFIVESYMIRNGVPKDVQTILKEYAFAAFDEAYGASIDKLKEWVRSS